MRRARSRPRPRPRRGRGTTPRAPRATRAAPRARRRASARAHALLGLARRSGRAPRSPPPRAPSPRPRARARASSSRCAAAGGSKLGSRRPSARDLEQRLAPPRRLRVEQPLDAVEPPAGDPGDRRRLVLGELRRPRLRPPSRTARSESRRNGTSWQRERIVSGSGPSSSATSTITAYSGGSSRSLSSASAASSFSGARRRRGRRGGRASNGRMCRSRRSSRIASIRIWSPSGSSTYRSGCARRSTRRVVAEQLRRRTRARRRACRPRPARGRGTRAPAPRRAPRRSRRFASSCSGKLSKLVDAPPRRSRAAGACRRSSTIRCGKTSAELAVGRVDRARGSSSPSRSIRSPSAPTRARGLAPGRRAAGTCGRAGGRATACRFSSSTRSSPRPRAMPW